MNWDEGSWDAGFWDVEITPNPPTNPPTKKTDMKVQAYFPSRVADQILWLEKFRNKLAGHAPTLGITVARCDAAVADAHWLVYVLGSWLPAVRSWQLSCTEAAKAARIGTAPGNLVLPVFTPPPVPAGVTPQPEGGLLRIFDIVAELKESNTYSVPIGMDLGVVGSGKTPPDFATLKPALKVRVVGTKVEIDWNWGGFSEFLDQCEIQVDRGTGWQVLTYDSTPGYTDTTAHPSPPTKWKYRAIYRVNDEPVGLWSDEVMVTVG